jgi:predicted metal-dependent hydrolase
MAERPAPLEQLDRYFAATTIAHEYIADLHRELAALQQDSERTWELLRESAAVVLEGMPELTRELRRLERDWTEQELLDPPQAGRTLDAIEAGLTDVEPELSALRERQDEIAADLRGRIDRARRP